MLHEIILLLPKLPQKTIHIIGTFTPPVLLSITKVLMSGPTEKIDTTSSKGMVQLISHAEVISNLCTEYTEFIGGTPLQPAECHRK